MSKKKLQDVWDYLGGNENLSDTADVERGVLRDEDRPKGVCWACNRFADGAYTYESPGSAKCCIGCDAYKTRE